MPDKNRHKTGQNKAKLRPVVVLAGLGEGPLPPWAQALADQGVLLFSRSKLKGAQPIKHGPGALPQLCKELKSLAPGCGAVLVRSPLTISADLWRDIETMLTPDQAPLALCPLSNACAELNPFAELSLARGLEQDPENLVSLLAGRRLHEWQQWPEHFAALNACAIETLAGKNRDQSNAVDVLQAHNGAVLIPEWWFVQDQTGDLHHSQRRDPHEQPRPVAWGGLRDRLDQWLESGGQAQPLVSDQPATLHITHSWGGGIAVWIANFINASGDEQHLQLRSEGPQTGQGAGQRLSLYAGNELRCPINSWWVQPPVEAVIDVSEQYQAIVNDIIQRFPVARVMVSSLIGHSLDALRTGLPTVQILHDHFPAWPLLSIHPREYESDLKRALKDPRASEQFRQRGVESWKNLSDRYVEAARDVALAAPSQSVIDVQRSLHAAWKKLSIQKIPHGLPQMAGTRAIKPRARDDQRLRLLIPGRVQSGKGADLLEQALAELTPLAQVYLLGTGKGGERFFGQRGVHVVLEYTPQTLVETVRAIGPDMAALLSIVPETFSYTLSEMTALGIPTIATKLGAFVERIDHGKNGWLIEPSPGALVEQIKTLTKHPKKLQQVRDELTGTQTTSMQDMLAAYLALCPIPEAPAPTTPRIGLNLAEAQAESLRDLNQRSREALRRAHAQQQSLKKLVEKRTQWALSEEQRRHEWVDSLNNELADSRSQLKLSNQELRRLYKDLKRRTGHIDQLDQQIDAVKIELADAVQVSEELRDELKQRSRHIAELDLELKAQTEELASTVQVSDELRDELKQRSRHIAELDLELKTKAQELVKSVEMADELRGELSQRAAHITSLDSEIDRLGGELSEALIETAALKEEVSVRAQNEQQLEQRLQHSESELQATQARLDHLHSSHQSLQQAYDTILASHSWRLTKPLRAGRRLAGNFMRARAWNPLRWPFLISQVVRVTATQGLGGTLQRMQYGRPQHEGTAPTVAHIEASEPGPDIDLPAALPSSERPIISVIVPVYNHLDHTVVCLRSLAATHCETPFEVIVVDDASSDHTQAALPEIAGLRYQRNPENLGFIHTCNNGAANARGEYVLFLNNDTEVQDGWLDKMLEVFEQKPDAGLVGARLVYPDGSLQECGGMIFSDGSGWNYGRNDEADKPQYQYLREVDYCSGACLMLRTSLYEQLGGFDTHYAPAYYEDTDLAFKVREAGLKVYVQPAATIVHFEGVSSGTDLESGTKRYQTINREKFLERWQHALKLQPPPIHDPENLAQVRASRDHRLKGRVLVVDAYTPEPDQDSGSVRLTYLMQCLLDLGYGVTFFPDNRAWAGRYTQALQTMGVQAWYDPWLESSESYLQREGADYDYVIVSRHYIATHYLAPVRKHAPDAKFIFDTVDLHYLREQRHAELEDSTVLRQTARQTRRSELAVINASDATLVVSPVEVAVLQDDAPKAQVHVLSNIHEVHGRGAGFAERKDLYFVGGYQHPPNIDAVEWFVQEIWPLARPQLPGVTFHIVGSKAPDSLREMAEQYADQAVRFHGFVEQLEPFLDGCRISVAPLRYGAGVKGKVNQSMSHGQPVVATPIAMEGLHAEDGRDALIAEDAASFADAVVKLYNDEALWDRLSAHGLENVQAHFSLEKAQADIAAMFRLIKAS